MKSLFPKYKCKIEPVSATVIIGILLFLSLFHYIFFHYEVEMIHEQIVSTDKAFLETKWAGIEGIIYSSITLAHKSSDMTANQIVKDVKREYPDLNVLKQDFDSRNYNPPKLTRIILDNIRGKYFYNIHNENNDIFVISRHGIIADLDLRRSDTINRTFEEEISHHFNPSLSYKSLGKILSHNNTVIYYEPDNPDDIEAHRLITNPSMESLKKVFMDEGIDGLKGYTFMVPSYITDDGDLFGTPDIGDTGEKTDNHKLIIVQTFNMYDIIMQVHHNKFAEVDSERDSIKQHMYEQMRFKTLVYLSIMSINIIVILFIIILSKARCPNKPLIDKLELRHRKRRDDDNDNTNSTDDMSKDEHDSQ